tara:strand:- start:3950 stop:4150 length:201 start_codon:yes stop_codon:yes gene_type:complete
MKNKKVLFIDKWNDVCEGIIIDNNYKHEDLPHLDCVLVETTSELHGEPFTFQSVIERDQIITKEAV